MKKIVLFLFAIFSIQLANAQDTIVKKDGQETIAKILEVNSTEIKYKKFDFQDGPIYVENISNIRLIKYSNGTKEEFQKEQATTTIKQEENTIDYYGGAPAAPSTKIEVWGNRYKSGVSYIGERQLHKTLIATKDKRIIALVGKSKDAHALQYIGFAAFPLGIGALYFLGNSVSASGQIDSGSLTASALCLVVGIVCPISSGIFKHNRMKYNKQAIQLYNETH